MSKLKKKTRKGLGSSNWNRTCHWKSVVLRIEKTRIGSEMSKVWSPHGSHTKGEMERTISNFLDFDWEFQPWYIALVWKMISLGSKVWVAMSENSKLYLLHLVNTSGFFPGTPGTSGTSGTPHIQRWSHVVHTLHCRDGNTLQVRPEVQLGYELDINEDFQ